MFGAVRCEDTEAVAMAGAIGQPDSFAGELPCVYVELVADAEVTVEELAEFARSQGMVAPQQTMAVVGFGKLGGRDLGRQGAPSERQRP